MPPVGGVAAARHRDIQGASRTVVVAAAIFVAGHELGLPWWASGLCAVYVASVAASARAMRATYKAWQAQSREWARLLEESEVGQELHDMASGVRPALDYAVAVLERYDPEAAEEARLRRDRVREQTAERLERWKTQDPSIWEAFHEGYLGGQRVWRLPGSQALVRYFAVYENTPAWLPSAIRRRAVPVLRAVDVVRLLHNDEIERRALIATLWVRAAVVGIAPLTASASLTGLVALRDGASPAATIVWIAAVAVATLMALLAPRIVTYTMHQDTRWWLYAAEQSLTIAAVVAAPCWAIAIYGAGAVNWLQRPDWRLRKLFAWMAITYVPFVSAALSMGAEPGEIASEAALAIAGTAIMAGSYGLMAPVTATTLVRALVDSIAWRIRVWRAMRSERRELRSVIVTVEKALAAHAAGGAEAADAAARARAARALLVSRRVTLRRRPRRLDRLLATAIADVVVPEAAELPAGIPEPQLRAAELVFRPPSLARLVFESGRNARRLDVLVKRIVQEAVDKGVQGQVHTYVRRAGDGRVDIEIANAVPARVFGGFGTGQQWLERARLAIPDAQIIARGERKSDHPELVGDVYSVVVRLGPTIFERSV